MPALLTPERILVVAAHPDDAEFGCGATVAKWIKAGAEAFILIGTNGDKGDDSGRTSPAELAGIRQEEQRQAAKIIGVKDVYFLNCADGGLEASDEVRGKIVEHIRRVKPDMVLTHDPSVVFASSCGVNHCDHRNIGLSTVDAVYPYARGVHQYPEHAQMGLLPHKVDQLLLWDTDRPDHWEDVTAFVDQKIDALAAHKSQMHDRVKLKSFVEANLARFGTNSRISAEPFRLIQF